MRKGTIKIHHFAHKPPVTCSYGFGETEEHRRCKTEIYEALCDSPLVTKAALERPLGDVRPDISAYIRGVPVAIEVQISTLPLATVIHRTKEYTKRKIALLWLAQWSDELENDRISPRPWELWFHAAYFGRVYYWKEGSTITPVHLDKHFLHVEEKTWYNSDGEEQSAGGFYRTSKRYRTPKLGDNVNLLTDFQKRFRDEFTCRTFSIPPALLYCDQGQKFW